MAHQTIAGRLMRLTILTIFAGQVAAQSFSSPPLQAGVIHDQSTAPSTAMAVPTTTKVFPRQAATTNARDLRAELAQKVDVIINGETYPLPTTGSVSLLQADRSTIVLQPSAVIALGQSVTVPPILSQTPPVPAPIDVGGLHLTVAPGQIIPPTKQVLDAFKDLSGLARQIEDGINDIKPQLDTFTGDDSSPADGLQGDFLAKLDSLINNIDSFDSQLTGLATPYLQPREDLPMENFGPAYADRISEAFGSTKSAQSPLKVLKGLLKTGGRLSGPLTATLRKWWIDHGEKIVLVDTLAAVGAFAIINWAAAVEPSQSTTTASATSTTSSSVTLEPTLYFFSSKYGTKKSDFEDFCHRLDNTAGHLVSRDGSQFQGYQTFLNLTQLALVRLQTFVDNVEAVPELGTDDGHEDFRYIDPLIKGNLKRSRAGQSSSPESFFGANMSSSLFARDGPPPSNMVTDDHSPSQLQLLSAWPGDSKAIRDSNYRYDKTSLGKGVTIYVVDSGFNKNAHDLQSGPQSRRVLDYTVPNRLSLSPSVYDGTSTLYDQMPAVLDSPEGLNGHGTGVAVAAAGLNYGVARSADLFLIKYKGTVRSRESRKLVSPQAQWGALQDAIDVVIADVISKGLKGKAVINMSFGIQSQAGQSIGRGSGLWNLFDKLERFCRENEVVWVAAAGNYGSPVPGGQAMFHLGDSLPQRIGTAQNALITVGGVNPDGWLWLETTPEGPARVTFPGEAQGDNPGSIDIYAQSFNVQLDFANANDRPDIEMRIGTSFAAPQVAGLAAYFINKHPNNQRFTNQIATEMKGALRRTMVHWQRDAGGQPVQAQVNSANNGARSPDEALCKRGEGQCPNDPPPAPAPLPAPSPPPPPKDAYTGKCNQFDLEFALYHDENCADPFDTGTICIGANDCANPKPGFSSMKIVNPGKRKVQVYATAYNKAGCSTSNDPSREFPITYAGCLNGFKQGSNHDGEKWTANSINIFDALGPSGIF